jgi:hypothetical protein
MTVEEHWATLRTLRFIITISKLAAAVYVKLSKLEGMKFAAYLMLPFAAVPAERQGNADAGIK